MVKKFILAAIAGLGIAGLFFVFQHTKSGIRTPEQSSMRKAHANLPAASEMFTPPTAGQARPHEQILTGNNLVSDRPFVEQLDEKSLKAAAVARDENNLTEAFTKNLAEKIALENSGGLIQDGNQKAISVPDPNQIAIDLLSEAAAKFDIQKLVPEIKDADIKITQNNKEVLLAFADKFDEANLGIELPKLNNQEEFNASIGGLIENYKKTIAALYELATPELFVNLHKTNLAYLSAELAFLEKMKEMQEDPMAAILASKNFLDLQKNFKEQLTTAVLQLDNLKLMAILNQ